VEAVLAATEPERWTPIPGYEGLYDVSSFGRVRRSTPSRLAPAGYLLGPRETHDGYVKYSLFKAGRYKHTTAHRLVALAFLGEPPFPKAQAAHYDGNKKNNRLSNLRWATHAENETDKLRHGTLRGAAPGERHHNAKLSAGLVAGMWRLAHAGVKPRRIAFLFNLPYLTAYDAIVGNTWKCLTNPMPLGRKREVIS
jgi:hypothetical protein